MKSRMHALVAPCRFTAESFVPALTLERPLYLRERNDGLYRPITYLLAKLFDELFVLLISSVAFSAIVFYAVDLQGSFLMFWIIYLVTLSIGVMLGYLVAALSPNMDFANAALPTYTVRSAVSPFFMAAAHPSLCLCASVSLFLCVSVYLRLCLSVSLSPCLCLSVHLCVSVRLWLELHTVASELYGGANHRIHLVLVDTAMYTVLSMSPPEKAGFCGSWALRPSAVCCPYSRILHFRLGFCMSFT